MTFPRSLHQLQAQQRRRPGIPTVEASVTGEPLVSADLAHTLAAIRQDFPDPADPMRAEFERQAVAQAMGSGAGLGSPPPAGTR